MRILVDTNVWVDNYVPDRPRHQTVGDLLSAAIVQGHDLLFSALSAKDVFYLVSHAYKETARLGGSLMESQAGAINEVAWACVENMGRLATAVGVDVSDLWLAQKNKPVHSDFEDDLILAASVRAKVDYLVTSDKQLAGKAPVTALSPEEMVGVLKA